MTNEDLLKLWRGMPSEGTMDEHIVRFGRMVQEATTEECAQVVENYMGGIFVAAAIRALSSGSPAPLPAGWKLVPIEPTQELKNAAIDIADGYENLCGSNVCDIYRAMITSAPAQPTDNTEGESRG